ncbi:MAG TPA: hypothetical protein VKR38_11470 [Usitatibacter sp.]|nr:hypothetical protein [Usitatibacter sp.]
MACAVFLSPFGDVVGAPSIGGCPVFPSNNYWNTAVDTLPVHASSNTWVNSIGASAKLHPDWGNVLADNYGIPYMTVDASQAPVAINFDSNGYADESDPGPMPIPTTAPIEGGSSSDGDRHVLVIDTSHCVLYELYNAFPLLGFGGPAWSVYSSAKFDLNSNALRPAGWTSADAAGLPIFPGLVRWDEIAAGEIAHAIRFTANNIWGRNNGQQEYLWPARHASGSSTDSTRPPMGARFRLKASFEISSFSANTQVVLRAFKKYGIVLADGGSNWYFQGVSDTRFPDTMFDELKSIAGGNFEAVDTSVIEVDPNTAESKQSGNNVAVNVQGLWWNSPANSESGWGINLTQQGDVLFATWFTYDVDGTGLWLVMSTSTRTGNAYTGALYRTTGPAFSASPWNGSGVTTNAVGTATFTFTDGNTGTFASTVNGFTQTKPIVRELFYTTAAPVCSEGATPGQNYQGLWWNPNESGWGVNLTHQADTLFATWFTYDSNGKGLWLVMSNGAKTAPGSYTGALYRTTGPAYNAAFSSAPVNASQVGTATFTFSDPSNGTFAYSVNGVSQSKAITRQIFFSTSLATACN